MSGVKQPLRTALPALLISEDDALIAEMTQAATPHQNILFLQPYKGAIENCFENINLDAYALFIVDIDAKKHTALTALQKMMIALKGERPVIVITDGFDEVVARWLLQIRVTDFAKKPIHATEVMNTCLGALHTHTQSGGREANITTFIPAAGGVGVTSLVIESAYLLHKHSKVGRNSTCIVDLNFQNGSIADYLDLEARLDLSEVEPRPERLDKQLLEVMLNYHSSGVAIIAAPNRPAEMRSFDPALVTRLLDLAASHFDNVVIDMPRTWFAWTDDVLMGSNQVFLVTEMTVPGLRHAQRLLKVVDERLQGAAKPKVIVNRFEDRPYGVSLKRSDVEAALGDRFAGTIPNNYRLMREAIDRGVMLEAVKPTSPLSTELKKIVMPDTTARLAPKEEASTKSPLMRLFGAKA